MPRELRIALCQMHSLSPEHADNLSENLANVDQILARAAKQGADIAVLPEYVLSGIMADDLHLAAEEGEHLEALQAMARKYKMDLVAGSIVEKSSKPKDDSDQLFNTAYYISAEGEVLHTYKKRNLWHPEKEYLTPSEEPHKAFQTSHFIAGMCICWDLAWPEAFRALMVQGAQVIFVPTYWVVDDLGPIGLQYDPDGDNEKRLLDSLVIARSYENSCCIVFVNAGGPANKGFIGRSSIAMPLLGPIARMEDPEEELRVVEIDLDVLDKGEQVYQVRADYAQKAAKRNWLPQSTT